jgi:hypothetical protein
MADALTTLTKIINSPPGQLAAGGVLAGIVWKFFERVEAVLTDNTKLEIAVWLLDRKKLTPKFQSWPNTFAQVFDHAFGEKHLSWECFSLSCYMTIAVYILMSVLVWLTGGESFYFLWPDKHPDIWRTFHRRLAIGLFEGAAAAVCLAAFDYLGLLQTRYLIKVMSKSRSLLGIGSLLVVDVVSVGVTGAAPAYLTYFGPTTHPLRDQYYSADNFERMEVLARRDGITITDPSIQVPEYRRRHFVRHVLKWWSPTFWTSVWLWLYAASGFLLIAASRFDIGFDWFNRKFDIEKKPLQSIGLVAGALVATVYWAAVIVSRVIG